MKTALVLCTTLVAGVACAAIDANAAALAALKQAGLTAVAPNALYVEPDRDDGRWVYEVKFHDGVSAYDCKIDATTGAVLKIERETLEQIPGVAAPKATQPVAQPGSPPDALQCLGGIFLHAVALFVAHTHLGKAKPVLLLHPGNEACHGLALVRRYADALRVAAPHLVPAVGAAAVGCGLVAAESLLRTALGARPGLPAMSCREHALRIAALGGLAV